MSNVGLQKTAFRELMKGVYTSIPGHVLALYNNGAQQRAQVQVGVERVDLNGASFALRPIEDVPVLFLGSDFAVEYQINPGTEGMIYFAHRCVDGWKNTGGVAQNPLGRFHNLQDAFFIPGFRSLPNVLPNFQNNGIRLRNRSGSQYVWLKNDGSIFAENGNGHIRMNPDGTVFINGVRFDTDSFVHTDNDFSAENITLKTHRQSGVEPGGGTSGRPVP